MTSLATTLGLRAGSAGAFVPNYAAAYLGFNFAWSYIGCTLAFNDFLFSPYLIKYGTASNNVQGFKRTISQKVYVETSY